MGLATSSETMNIGRGSIFASEDANTSIVDALTEMNKVLAMQDSDPKKIPTQQTACKKFTKAMNDIWDMLNEKFWIDNAPYKGDIGVIDLTGGMVDALLSVADGICIAKDPCSACPSDPYSTYFWHLPMEGTDQFCRCDAFPVDNWTKKSIYINNFIAKKADPTQLPPSQNI